MAKDTYYFSHDYNTRTDPKIKKLISKHGFLGYGLFWAIIEDLYNNTNVLRLDYESIAYDLRTSPDIIEQIIIDFDLFIIEGNNFGSFSVQKRLDAKDVKSKKAIESVRKRWDKINTNVLQSYIDSNTIKGKETILKEIKGKEIKGKDVAKENLPLSDYQLCVEFWLKEFHPDWEFKAIHGKALKSIIKQLSKIVKDNATIPESFKHVCKNLPDWYKNKDLQIIDSKFNEIITEIKNKANGTIDNNGKPVSKYAPKRGTFSH